MHLQSHPYAHKTVKIKDSVFPFNGAYFAGQNFRIEDWWDIDGESWRNSKAVAAYIYRLRAEKFGLPMDDEVIYGKMGNFGHLMHISELEF